MKKPLFAVIKRKAIVRKIFFKSVMLSGILVLCLVGLPSFSVQTASQMSFQSEDVLSENSFTSNISATPILTFSSTQIALQDSTADAYFVAYAHRSWEIPEEISAENTLWIEVDLTSQMLYAYQGRQLIGAFLVSTGVKKHQTVTGTYKIYAKYPKYTMEGPGYFLEDVPYSMFFYKGYALHGTYWHNNFGRPMSHGCVNMITNEAAWLYDKAPVGTYVVVHY